MGVSVAGRRGDQVVDEMARQWDESRRRLQMLTAEHEQLADIKNKVQVNMTATLVTFCLKRDKST